MGVVLVQSRRGSRDPDSGRSGDYVNHLLGDGNDLRLALLNRRCEHTADGGGDDEQSLHLHGWYQESILLL